jgi:hypothetical protein
MNIFRIVIGILWIALVFITVRALRELGVDGANIFVSDLAHPWRLQFNADFSAHVVLMAAWMIYRERNLAIGIICAVLAGFIGGAFSLAYILVATFRAGGDAHKLLLGCNI